MPDEKPPRQPGLFDNLDDEAFGGETYDPERDYIRLKGQLQRTFIVMKDEKWRTLKQIANEASAQRTDGGRDSEAAISARLRDFRKKEFGGYDVLRRNDGGGLWRYRLLLSREEEEPAPGEPPPTNAYLDEQGRVIHNKCVDCDQEPSFSVGFFPRKGQLGMWYCKEHWPGWAKIPGSSQGV